MKLEIIPDKETYYESLGISEEDWELLRFKIEDEVIEYSEKHNGLNCMDILIDLCDRYAETPTEVATISLIVGQLYMLGLDPLSLLKASSEFRRKIKKDDGSDLGGLLSKLFNL